MTRTTKIVIGAAALGLLCSIPAFFSDNTPAQVPVAVQQAADKDHLERLRALDAVTKLKSTMRNPDSFAPFSVIAIPDGSLCIAYRAQNGFGGLAEEQAVETPKGKITVDIDTYNHFCADKTGTELWSK